MNGRIWSANMNGRIWSCKSLMNFFFWATMNGRIWSYKSFNELLFWAKMNDRIWSYKSFKSTTIFPSYKLVNNKGKRVLSLSHMNLTTITAYCLGVRKSDFYLTWMKLTIDNPTRIYSFFLNFNWKMSKVFWQCLITTLFLIGKQALLSLDHIIVCPLLWKSN